MRVTESKPANGVIKLDCEATAQEVNNALREAAQAFAMSMGVRPAPGKSVEEAAKEQLGISDLDKIIEPNAIEVLVPRALDRRNLVPAFPPKAVPTVKFERGKKFSFTLNVTVKPTYELKSYEPVEITVEPFVFDESAIDNQIAELAKNSVTYVVTDPKPLTAGDACSIAMKCYDDGEEIKALTCEDRTYLMGQGYMPAGFDEELVGMEPGQTKEFTFEAPLGTENGEVVNKPIKCTVTVNDIQKEVEPVIDDAWVKDHMPMFASLEALRADMRRVFEAQQREGYEGYVQQMAVGQLTRRFEGRIADEIYEATRDQLMQNLRMELSQAGMTWEQFVAQNGGEQQFGMMLMMQTREVLVQGFCLDAVFRHEKMTLTDKDLEDACYGMNPQGNPKVMREELEASGRGFALRETAERLKAARFVAAHAIITTRDSAAAAAPATPAADKAEGDAAKADEN
ncbi:trigger factor [Adlercreutzia sp. R25]|uniref:Trigger factor n=1 Tax=Adlercreutzia shanghongiae TaxID=3111773 RepID=A0ABU6IY84_9ACTN|nr:MULTISPECIES: trigger factor [unclassified Adlercreutzia]MEC4271644.1 trigger factor [Adlercreutzia sp. R25]MEC4294650.1 trigger factor [Adlercreutzia sp. R22]